MKNHDSIHDVVTSIKSILKGIEEEDIMNLEVLVQKAHDPIVLATLIAALIEERRKTNKILEEIRESLRMLASAPTPHEELSESDERILALARERGSVCAEEVRAALGYKGLNAASARLNSLVRKGILRKVRKGRKVYFIPV